MRRKLGSPGNLSYIYGIIINNKNKSYARFKIKQVFK